MAASISTASPRALRMLAAARGAMLRRASRAPWLSDLCRALVDSAGFRAAAIGVAMPGGPAGRLVARVTREADGAVVDDHTAGASLAMREALAHGVTIAAPANALWPEGVTAMDDDARRDHAWLAVPCLRDGRAVAGIEVVLDRAARFDADDLAALHALADDLGEALAAPLPAASGGDSLVDVEHVRRMLDAAVAGAPVAPGADRLSLTTAADRIARDVDRVTDLERAYRTMVERIPEPIVRVDPAGRYLFANPAFAACTGVPVAAALGRRLDDVLTGDAPGVKAGYAQLHAAAVAVARGAQPRRLSQAMRLPDGPVVWDVWLVPERDASGAVASVLLVARDITQREKAAEVLRDSEERLRQLTDHVHEVLWLRDAVSGVATFVSRAGDLIVGDRERLLAGPEAWLAIVHPEDRVRVAEAQATQREYGYDLEYRVLRDGEVRWVRDRAWPVRDADGGVRRIAGTLDDVTARRTLEQQLRHAQKMEAIGQLAGGVAHDFNNLLAVVQMQTSLLLAGPTDRATLEDGLREVLAATERASNLTRQLLTFSRRHVTQHEDLDLVELIGGMAKLLRRILGDDVTLETRFAPHLPRVRADRGMVEQVLMSLAVNSRDAMPSGGRLTVSLDAVEVDGARVSGYPGVSAGRFVRLTVSDSGTGIPAESLPHVFEPFFTTKEVGKGTGLGLATVFGILQQHQGWIEVDSLPTEGATFRAYLPALRGGVTAVAPPSDTVTPRGHETILFVEDEPAVRAIVRGALERFGYTVIEAGSAVHARDLWPGVRDRVDLLITDVILPGGMSGRDLADLVTADRPELGVIYITGYGPEFVGVGLQPGHRLLQKPFAASALARIVRQVIDERARLG